MKKIILFFVCIGLGVNLYSQQIAQSSHFSETRYVWNPAFTAHGTEMQMDAFFRMQWLGFEGAPKTGYASFLYPFIDYNMSFGGVLLTDHTGLVSQTGIQLNYAYKLKGFLGDEDQVSFGLGGSFTQFGFNAENEIYNDLGDLLISTGKSSKFFPSISVGLSYFSHTEEFDKTNIFYFGFAMNQVYASELSIENALLQRERHVHFTVGAKFFGYDSYIEPTLSFNTVNPEILHMTLSAKYELEERFWVGLGYGSGSEVTLQGGIIMGRFIDRYSTLRIGALGNINTSQIAGDTGPGFEILVSYLYDLD